MDQEGKLAGDVPHLPLGTSKTAWVSRISVASSSDIVKPISNANGAEPVGQYRHGLNWWLEELGGIDGHGDAEMRGRGRRLRPLKAIRSGPRC